MTIDMAAYIYRNRKSCNMSRISIDIHRVRIRVHFTMGPGFYCTVDKKEKPDETFLAKVEARMRELAKMAIPIQKRCIDTGEAVELFHKYGMYDKERLFAYRRVSKVNLYSTMLPAGTIISSSTLSKCKCPQPAVIYII